MTAGISGSAPGRRGAEDDVELVSRVAAGDQQALTALLERFGPLLLGLARRVLGSTEEAEDIVQEVLLQVWRQAGRYRRERSSVSTWLVLLTRSRAIDRLRGRRVRARTTDRLISEAGPGHASSEGPAAVVHGERRERLLGELAKLPQEQRDVLEMAFYRGLTQSQIAERTGIPLGTVKTRTLLAMKKLRAALADEIEDLL